MMPVFMYAATLGTPDGGTTCNIFWPSDDDYDEVINGDYVAGNATISDEDYVPPVVRGQ